MSEMWEFFYPAIMWLEPAEGACYESDWFSHDLHGRLGFYQRHLWEVDYGKGASFCWGWGIS